MQNQNYRPGNDRNQHGRDHRNEPHQQENAGKARAYLENNIREILRMSKSEHAKDIISNLSDFVKFGCTQLTTHQIRNIYGVVKRHGDVSSIHAIARPHMVNIAKKQEQEGRQAVELFEKVLESVEKKEEVNDCHLFFEAIVCYHKYHHGDKNK